MRRRFQAAGHHSSTPPASPTFRTPSAPTLLTITNASDTAVLYVKAPLGIVYIDDNPTIEVRVWDADWNQVQKEIAGNATEWWVVDDYGLQVAHGTLQTTTTRFNVSQSGTWIGGSAMRPGYYQVVTNRGTNGTIMVRSLLNLPRVTARSDVATFLSTAPDRDGVMYIINGQDNASDILGYIQTDKYFTAAQDPARPHEILISPGPQSLPTDPSPTAAQWGQLAASLVGAGHAGAWYEVPTNEPENGGWSMPALIAYYNACYDAVKAADPTAKVIGFDSAGITMATNRSSVGTFLAGVHGIDGFSNHMEHSTQRMSTLIGLRQLFAAFKGIFSAAGRPNLPYWNTETGILGGGWNVMHPRRDARERTILRLVAESYGWSKERQYDFAYDDHIGSGLPMYITDMGPGYDPNNPAANYSDPSMLVAANMRMGGYAIHIMSEALYGTTCTVQNPPTKLSFGAAGGVRDSMYLGLHYTGVSRDVVAIATNGIESGTVTLNVSATGSVTCWDGVGKEYILPVTGGQIIVPVNDLVSYVFLPKNCTVSVAAAWWTQEGEKIGAWTNSAQEGDVPGVTEPIDQSTVPYTFTLTLSQPATGFALATAGPAWQTSGCSLTDFDILDGNNNVLYHYECASAVTQPIRSGTARNSSDECTHTTFWTSPFGWIEKVNIPAGTVKLRVNKTNYGGQADAVGFNVAQDGEQQIRLGVFQVLR